ncbi:LytR/AlgR family response regulator transcription factor [Hugenholtzia roseola]|uniref:LytR/AlgR family response regulator transcription factor n=1 Tax=Hugenholtzia roseola TaxID=1002 RepID=UPI0003F7D5C8|nr:response regulator [Hugenholtzia roseola]
MRIIIVEDDPLYAATMERLIVKMGYQIVGITDNADTMLQFFQTLEPDLALLDIHVKGSMNGIELAKKVQKLGSDVPIIFVTSFADGDTFEQAKKTLPYAYIIKPINVANLQRTIELALMRQNFKEKNNKDLQAKNWEEDILIKDSIFVKYNSRIIKVPLRELSVLEAKDKYVKINTTQENYLVRMSLREILEKLPPTEFVQIHRSVVINASRIENIELRDNTVQVGGEIFDIGRNYKDAFLKRLNMLL